MNLVVALALGQAIFLLGISATENKVSDHNVCLTLLTEKLSEPGIGTANFRLQGYKELFYSIQVVF